MKHTESRVRILRGICTVSLLLCHSVFPECPEVILALHAGLFCALEGARKKTEEDLRGAFVRLMVPYILACLGMAALSGISGILVYRDLSTASFTHCVYRALLAGFAAAEHTNSLAGTAVSVGVPVMWILPVLFLARSFAEFVQHICEGRKGRMAAAAAFCLAGWVSLRFVRLPFGLQYALVGAALMMLGEYLISRGAGAEDAAKRNALEKGISLAGDHAEIILAAYGAAAWSLDWIAVPGMHLLLAFVSAWLVKKAGGFMKSRAGGRARDMRRDPTADIMKGVMICLMILGHDQIDGGLRAVIYSIHMMAFVFVSGCFYRGEKKEGLLAGVIKLLRSVLIPYAIFGVLHMLFVAGDPWDKLKSWVLCVSISNRLFTDVAMIGPVYFMLMLLGTRVVYLILDRMIRRTSVLTVMVILLSLLGMWLGRMGYWLAWSFDCALYALIFYHAGYLCRKHGVLDYVWKNLWALFPLCGLWAVMIACGGMELFVREYGNYALVISGSVCGILAAWTGCRALSMISVVRDVLGTLGRNVMYILWAHTLLWNPLQDFLYMNYHVSRTGIIGFGLRLFIQIALGLMMGAAAGWVKRLTEKRKLCV